MSLEEALREIERRDEMLAYDAHRIAELEKELARKHDWEAHVNEATTATRVIQARERTRKEARTQALEEAAKVAEEMYDPGQQPEHDIGHDIALTIRALKEKP